MPNNADNVWIDMEAIQQQPFTYGGSNPGFTAPPQQQTWFQPVVQPPPPVKEVPKVEEPKRFSNPNFLKIEMVRALRNDEGFEFVYNIDAQDRSLYEQLIMEHAEFFLEIRSVAYGENNTVVPGLLGLWALKGTEYSKLYDIVADMQEKAGLT